MNVNKHKIEKYLQLLGTFFLYSFAGVFSKMAALQENIYRTIIFMGIEFLLLAVYALIWQQVLKKFDLITAMSCKGVTVIYSLGWATFLFNEDITVWNLVGSLVVMLGVWVVTTDA